MNGVQNGHGNVYVVGFKFSGAELVQKAVDKLLAVQYAYCPPSCRNGATSSSTCLIDQTPAVQFQHHLSLTGTKVVFIVRNPKDVAVAMHKNSGFDTVLPFSDFLERFFSGETENGRWFEHTSQWLEILSSLGPAQSHIIYFDTLIQDIEGEIKRLCSFLGIQLSHDRGLALCTQLTQESEQPQRKRQRTNNNIDGHKETYYQVGLWKTYFTVGHNEAFNTKFLCLLSNIKLLDLDQLLS